MSKKIFAALVILTIGLGNCFGQTDDDNTKKYDHYVGFQANELLKQIINLNNSNSSITNPYLLTYYIKNNSNGWGINVGLGYNYQDSKAVNTPTPQETKINDLSFRIGIGRRFMISKRFETGYSFDFIVNSLNNQTFTPTVNITNVGNGNVIDSSFATTTIKTTTYGFGPQFFLGFHISNRVLLGTEASYYFLMAKQKTNSNVVDKTTDETVFPFSISSNISNSNAENDNNSFSLSIPVAIFLIVKF